MQLGAIPWSGNGYSIPCVSAIVMLLMLEECALAVCRGRVVKERSVSFAQR